ncbi:hypothetical protein TI39_contig469g00006 [Zymoseptoria brevis]|uniref:Uncharacterized protein n=1 Tax=Zymoseptoria brevis TaxID=1047168 RepID=A0A0F4GKU4_9PEZI|nr:hypothetical protein TI39_contig469g00006 [Zymoseptoria brevis]
MKVISQLLGLAMCLAAIGVQAAPLEGETIEKRINIQCSKRTAQSGAFRRHNGFGKLKQVTTRGREARQLAEC